MMRSNSVCRLLAQKGLIITITHISKQSGKQIAKHSICPPCQASVIDMRGVPKHFPSCFFSSSQFWKHQTEWVVQPISSTIRLSCLSLEAASSTFQGSFLGLLYCSAMKNFNISPWREWLNLSSIRKVHWNLDLCSEKWALSNGTSSKGERNEMRALFQLEKSQHASEKGVKLKYLISHAPSETSKNCPYNLI